MHEGHWTLSIGNLVFNMDTIITMWITMILLIVVSFIATRKLSIFPSKLQVVFESIINYFSGIVSSNMGEKEGKKTFAFAFDFVYVYPYCKLVGTIALEINSFGSWWISITKQWY